MPPIRVQRTLLASGALSVVLSSPEERNPLDNDVMDVLEEGLFSGAYPVVVLSAVPGPAFSAGGDLRLGPERLSKLSDRIYALCRRVVESPTVFVAAADGLVVAGGAQLFLAADLRVVGHRLALRPAMVDRELCVGTWSLPGLVGRGRALDLLLTGRELAAEEALAWGAADRLADQPTDAAWLLAEALVRLPEGYRLRVKRAVAASIAMDALGLEESTFAPPLYHLGPDDAPR